jgi:hypothetical protein
MANEIKELTHWVNDKYVDDVLQGKHHIGHTEDDMKPTGLWLSVNGDWERWFTHNWEDWGRGKTQLVAEIPDDLDLFVIDDVDKFLDEWKWATGNEFSPTSYLYDTKKFHKYLYDNYDGVYMDWGKVMAKRLSITYFYPWDASSIVIFDSSKVTLKRKEGDQ